MASPTPTAPRLPRAAALAFALCAAAGAACTPDPPTLTPQLAQVTDASPAGLGLRIQLDAYNPNSITLAVRSVSARVTLAERIDLGAAELPSGVSLASKAHTPVVVDLRLPWRNAAELAMLAATQPSTPYRIDGTAKVGGERLNVDLPFQLRGTLTREQLLGAGLRGIMGVP
jgi:LEA14-like dessication related protein